MKKVIVVSLLIVSWICAKSVVEVQNEWQQQHNAKSQEAFQKWYQNDEVQRLTPHCRQAGDNLTTGVCERLFKLQIQLCEKGEVALCADIAQTYSNGWDTINLSPNLKQAQKYADKVCTMDAIFCASMSRLFKYKDRKLALKYAEKACEMGELSDCVVAAELYAVGFGGVGKNPKKVKYYADKLCKGGVSEACE